MENIIYGRFMRKEEARQTRKSNLLGKTTDEELVPAFEATKVLGVLDELSSEKLKIYINLLAEMALPELLFFLFLKKNQLFPEFLLEIQMK